MKAQDLRLGNYVGFKNRTDCYCIIEELSSYGGVHIIRMFNDGDIDDQPEVIEDITGLYLTEEWLMKFGFYKEDDVAPVSNDHSHFYSMGCNDYKYSFAYASFRDDWGFYHSYTDACDERDNNKFDAISFGIKYVHQLQNLYFALTGEELTIK
jgi:hypothetical protein